MRPPRLLAPRLDLWPRTAACRGGSAAPADGSHLPAPSAAPERPIAARRRDGGEHAAGLRIDLLDAILGDLKQVPAVEGGSGMPRDLDRAHHLAARRIQGVHLIAGREPDMPAVEGDPGHLVDTRKG